MEDFDGSFLASMCPTENFSNDVDQIVLAVVEKHTHFLVTIVRGSIVGWSSMVTMIDYVQQEIMVLLVMSTTVLVCQSKVEQEGKTLNKSRQEYGKHAYLTQFSIEFLR